MDPQSVFCPYLDCAARGQAGEGNIRAHSHRPARYRCTVCARTFSARAGTPYFGRRREEQLITQVVTLVGHGCPVPAVEAAFGIQARTVQAWVDAVGLHCAEFHQAQVVQPHVRGQVQADEIRVKTQAGVLWVAMAIVVTSRLWLGAAVSPQRNYALIERLVQLVAACAAYGPLLFVSDGLTHYLKAVRRTFRTPQRGRRGRPRLIAWPEVVYAQVVKQYTGRVVQGTQHRLRQGSVRLFLTLLWSTPGCQVLNTAFIERLNGTFRARLAVLGRRTRVPARRAQTVEHGLYLVGTLYNFCCVHRSLSSSAVLRTPAMAAGLTNHVWTVDELLHHHIPPPRWQPPRRRGRRSRALQALIDRWCPTTG